MIKRSKYGNKKARYSGRLYDSKFEAKYAEILDWRIRAGEVTEVVPQYKLELCVMGVHICNYIVDFKVTLADGTVEYHEVKGFETDLWKIKWRLAQVIYGSGSFRLINEFFK